MNSGLAEILAAFSCGPETVVRSLGKGNINTTYLVEASPSPFVLQKINRSVFPDPGVVVDNHNLLYNHYLKQPAPKRQNCIIPEPLLAADKLLSFVDDGGNFWRAQKFVQTRNVDVVKTSDQAFSIGRTLARFHEINKSLEMEELANPLPGFHQLSGYLQSYDSSVSKRYLDYENSLSYCHEQVARYRTQAGRLEARVVAGEITLQPVHGDPKVDNFIYDSAGCGCGMLDLDTVGAGIIYHDLGDCLRSVCNVSGEGPSETEPPSFNLDFFEALVKGYCSVSSSPAANLHPELIYEGLLAICFELGVRFFTDHLQGNIYFKVKKQGENLLKAKKQFLLCEEIVGQRAEICSRAALITGLHAQGQ